MASDIESLTADLVAGKYQLTRLLGRGGMGSVWEGVHTSLGTRVAVKFIESEYVDSQEARSRFENEARAAATLQSKHVVQVYDHGVMPDGRPYIVMEYLAGEPLDARLDRLGRLAPAETARIMRQVAKALARAHRAGIVHRDLKPENVFLVWDDDEQTDIAKVVDFGIAKFTSPNMGVSSATRTGSVLGTPYYMSPEQARGLRTVDHRTDLWALGVITYRCLVGELPFTGEAIGDLLVKICTASIPRPTAVAPDLPPAFDAWFERSMARTPEQRFASAEEQADALAVALGSGRGEMNSAAELLPAAGQAAGGTERVGSWPGADPMSASRAGAATGSAPLGASAQTGSPFTQTPPLAQAPRRGGALMAWGLLGLFVVLGGVGGTVWFFARGTAAGAAIEPAADSALASADESAPAEVGLAAAAPVTDEPAPRVEEVVSPPASASVAVEPSQTAAAPVARPIAPRVTGPAKPAVTATATATPAPMTTATAKPKPKPVTDVGY